MAVDFSHYETLLAILAIAFDTDFRIFAKEFYTFLKLDLSTLL